MSIVLDLILVALIAVCVFSGYRKGLILSIASVLVLVISILVGGMVARATSPQLSQTIEPYIGWLSEDATDEVIAEMDETLEDIDSNRAYEVIEASFLRMGLAPGAAEELAGEGHALMTSGGYNLRKSISVVFVDVLTYMIIFLIVFAVCAAALTIVLNVVGSSFEMPNLGLTDKIGGSALGLIYGLTILLVVCWLLRYGNAFIPKDLGLVESTAITKFFVNHNLLTSILGL